MKNEIIQKATIALTAIAAIGVSIGNAALTVNTSITSSAVATELRALSRGDWATVNSSGMVATSIGIFTRNDAADDLIPFATFQSAGDSLRIEELYSDAGYTNELRIELGDLLLMSSKPDSASEGVMIQSDAPPESLDKLVFKTNATGGPDPSSAGDVYLYDNMNLRSYMLTTGNTRHFIWALEDIQRDSPRNDFDYNDYLFYAQLTAVPEPATVITAIAVGFLGLTILRRRSKMGKQVI